MSMRVPSVEGRLGMPRSQPHEQEHQRKHRVLNTLQLLLYKLVFAHLGKFMIVALYFIATQWLHGQHFHIFSLRAHAPQVKQTWDSLLSASIYHGGFIHLMSTPAWRSMRHIVFRGLLEGVLGYVLFNQMGFNVVKYRAKLKPDGRTHWWNKVLASPYQRNPDGSVKPVTGLQYAFFPVYLVLITIALGIPLYLALHYGLAQAAHWSWLEPHYRTTSFVQRLYVGDYDGLIIGVIVGFIAAHSYRAYLYANTMNGGRSWVRSGRGPKWWMPWPTRELIGDLREEGVERQHEVLALRSTAATRVAAVGMLVGLVLAAYGFYILKTFAH